jgi:hypothetical protein
MRGPSSRAFAVGAVVGFVVSACSDAYLYDQRREAVVPSDRTVSLEGAFCTPATDEVIRPIKILIAMDASQSMKVTDPNGTRAQAVADLIANLPQEKEVYLTTMVFAGSTTAFLTKSGLNEFESITSLSPTDVLLLQQRILNYTNPSTAANRDSTDFVKPLADIYALINRDLANTRLSAGANANQTMPKYSVIFLSDGQPTDPQDDQLLCGDAVRRIRQLKDLADDVTVNTVNVFLPAQPIASSLCDFDGGITVPVGGSTCALPQLPPGTCPMLIVEQDAERLKRMAQIGGGDFRDFRNNEPINFLSFRFGQTRRTYVFDKLVVTNFSAPADSPLDEADTDSDHLLDVAETNARTSPWVPDTDTDGFSDGVEIYFKSRGANFTPNQRPLPDGGGLDPGCPPALRGVDSDCDGLTDCDEQIIGTNALRIDSDDDGVPDSIEWQLGTQPSSNDLDQDPDNDSLPNGQELALHTDPLVSDSAHLSTDGYRYQVARAGPVDAQGRQCFTFRVDNVLLANTLPDTRDAGNPDGGAPLFRRGAGFNDLMLSVSMRPSDDSTGHTLVKVFRHQTSRFPVGGIRSPVDGVIHVNPTDLVSTCGQSANSTTP